MISSRKRCALLGSILTGVGVLVVSLSASGTLGVTSARAGQSRGGPDADVMQVIADVVLIESRCRQVDVDYGRLFDFARANGINPIDIMPMGVWRPGFDAAYGRRAREMNADRLCGDLAAERAAMIPGVFTAR